MSNREITTFLHFNKSNNTIAKLFASNPLLNNSRYTYKSFLDERQNEKSNYELILKSFKSKKDKKSASEKYELGLYGEISIPNIITFYIDKYLVNIDLINIPNNSKGDRGSKLIKYLESFSKRKLSKYENLHVSFKNVKVWAYIDDIHNMIDVSPYIESLSLNHSKSGGGISIILSNLNYENGNVQNIYDGLNYYFDINDDKISQSFFEKVLKYNTPIFVSLEDTSSLDCNVNNVSKVWWNMIGLCKLVSVNNYQTQVQINDLQTILNEDGVYYYIAQYKKDRLNVFINNEGEQTQRVAEKLESFYSYGFQSIESLLYFVFDNLSNISITDDILFNSYNPESITKLGSYQSPTQKGIRPKKRLSPSINDFNVNGINLNVDEITSDLTFAPAKGIWKIIDLIVDSDVAQYHVANPSLSIDRGTLMSFVNKICYDPFVEFYGDTYANKFYFMAKKPPFDRKGYLDGIENCVEINLNDIQDSPNFRNTNIIYSAYKINPSFIPGGSDDISNQFIFPALFFDSYEQKYGSKVLEINDDYFPFLELSDPLKSNKGFIYHIDKYFEDFRYIIESNSYLPFAREGQISINYNPSIKSNSFIYFAPTNEYYYVDQVTHSVNFNGSECSTLLNVSRGLIKDFVLGKEVDEINIKYSSYWNPIGDRQVSYFNIISTKYEDLLQSIRNEKKLLSPIEFNQSTYLNVLGGFKENKEVFKFFENKKQFV